MLISGQEEDVRKRNAYCMPARAGIMCLSAQEICDAFLLLDAPIKKCKKSMMDT